MLKWNMEDLVEVIENRIINKFDNIIFIEGARGIGKSSLAFKILSRVNIQFNDGRKFSKFSPKRDIVYSRDDVLKQFASKKFGCVFADEMVNVANNRDFYMEDQKTLLKALNMYRDAGNIFIGCIPRFIELDKQIQRICAIRITVLRRGFALIQRARPSYYAGDVWDTKANQKLENSWSSRGFRKPRYNQLTTVVGYLKFGDITKQQRALYEQLKEEKRNNVFAKYQKDGIGLDSESLFYKNLIDSLNLSTGFVLDYKMASHQSNGILFYFNETGTASNSTNNMSYHTYVVATTPANQPIMALMKNYDTGASGVIKQFNSNFSGIVGIGNRFLDYKIEVEKDTFNQFDYNLSVNYGNGSLQVAKNTTATPMANFQISDRNVHATSGTICLYDTGNEATNFTNLTLYQKVNTSLAEDLPYILASESVSNVGLTITLNSPAVDTKFNITEINFSATLTPTGVNISNVTINLYEKNSSLYLLNLTETISFSGNTTLKYNWTFNLTDGDDWKWNITTSAGTPDFNLTRSAERGFLIDSSTPILTLHSPVTNLSTLNEFPRNHTLNFTALDSNLDSCWFYSDGNATTTTFSCNNSQLATNFSQENYNTIFYFANDTLNNTASANVTFYIYNITHSVIDTDPITEGGTTTNTLIINVTNVSNIINTTENHLVWNGTSRGSSATTILTNDSMKIETTFSVPSILEAINVNYTWFYNISDTVTNFNISGQQAYTNISITECGVGEDRILNYTLYDEGTKIISNGSNATIEVDARLISQSNTSFSKNFSITKNDADNFQLCVASGTLDNTDYRLDATARYVYASHVVEYNYIQNFNLTNLTIPIHIPLYDLMDSQSTSFLLTFKDSSLTFVDNAVIDILRYYVGEGLFISVEEAKTDATGLTSGHFVEEDVIYKFVVTKEGTPLYISPELKAICKEALCQINLRADDFGNITVITHETMTYSYQESLPTRTATFTFATKDSSSKKVNLTIYTNNGKRNESVCSNQVTSSSGVIQCQIPNAYKNQTYMSYIYVDEQPFGISPFQVRPTSRDIFGNTGYILAIFGFLTLALMGVSSGVVLVLFGILGLALMGALNLVETGSVTGILSGIVYVLVAGAILLFKMTQGRKQ